MSDMNKTKPPKTLNQLIEDNTKRYLCSLIDPDPVQIGLYAKQLKEKIDFAIDLTNTIRERGNKLKKHEELYPWATATLLLHVYEIRTLQERQKTGTPPLILIYNTETGLYDVAQTTTRLHKIILDCDYNYTKRQVEDVLYRIQHMAKQVQLTEDSDLLAVQNGIYCRSEKKLLPFDPKYVFTTKSKVCFNPNAANPCIQMPDGEYWNFDDWLIDTAGSPDVAHLLWCIIAAILQPMVRWGKSIWLYSEKGNNGKGTFLELLRNLCGDYASVQLSDMSKPYALSEIINTSAIITDENDCDIYIDKLANFKAMVTGDVIQLERKYRDPISFIFHGLIIQCINSLPKIKDKSESMLRRLLIIPFTKCFTGQERRYIKTDYMNRKEVLEYVLKTALELNIDELPEPAECKRMLNEYQEFNDSAIAFWNEFSSQFVWDLLPFEFLYRLYIAWFQNEYPCGKPQNSQTFKRGLIGHLATSEKWSCDKSKKIWAGNKMDNFEPLILTYNLTDYMSTTYKGSDPIKRCEFTKKPNYRGVVRLNNKTTTN